MMHKMKTIFITGASSGLGKASAKLFSSAGWRVIATMRQPDKEKELTNIPHVTLLPLDVTNKQQVIETTAKAMSMGVDVVFNNAGVGLGGPFEGYTEEQMRQQFELNFWGVVRVIQAFVPYFRERKNGLFLTTTSIGGVITFPFYSIYSASKWALEGFCESLSFELGAFGIGVKTISPGGIRSSFRTSTENVQHEAYNGLFEQVFQAFVTGKTPTIVSTPEDIASVVYEAATDGKDQLRYHAGRDAITYMDQRTGKGAEKFRQDLKGLFLGER
jgi:NAD(P)-dependent dehydrogenase (short-subunit alcohol dehydrogenase family)